MQLLDELLKDLRDASAQLCILMDEDPQQPAVSELSQYIIDLVQEVKRRSLKNVSS